MTASAFSVLLLAAAPSRIIVVEKGETPWWVPFIATLLTVLVAGLASYVATWWFKKRDIDGENARQAASLVDDAEDALSDLAAHSATARAELVAQAERLLREARRSSPPTA